MNWTPIRKQLGNRTAIVGAGVAGFLVGAGGFVAAQIDDSPRAGQEVEIEVETEAETETESTVAGSSSTTDDSMPQTTVTDILPDDSATPTSIDLTVPGNTIDDSTDDTIPTNTIDDSTDDSIPTNTIDDSSDDSIPTNTIDDSSDDSIPTNTIDDHGGDRSDDDGDDHTSSVPDDTIDDSTSSSVPASLPAAFSRSYQSAGGSIDVTWTGTAFVLNSVSPAPGFAAEIEDQAWDRIRVDFEGDGDARIEVRLGDGQIRVRID